jgi:3-oxoacyl-[acyl-carrier protein] reductase
VDLGLSGRTALVCGASSGLGLASAEALAEEGANVVLFARRADELEAHAARLDGLAVSGDVREDIDLERAVSAAVDRFGGLDVLVWNGGGPPPGGMSMSIRQ